LRRYAALPPDVRKRSALPSNSDRNRGCAPKTGRSPRAAAKFVGRPEAFRTSDGRAARLNYFLGKADRQKSLPATQFIVRLLVHGRPLADAAAVEAATDRGRLI